MPKSEAIERPGIICPNRTQGRPVINNVTHMFRHDLVAIGQQDFQGVRCYLLIHNGGTFHDKDLCISIVCNGVASFEVKGCTVKHQLFEDMLEGMGLICCSQTGRHI